MFYLVQANKRSVVKVSRVSKGNLLIKGEHLLTLEGIFGKGPLKS